MDRVWCSTCKVTKPVYMVNDSYSCEYCNSKKLVFSIDNTFIDNREQKVDNPINKYNTFSNIKRLLYDKAIKKQTKEEFVDYCGMMNLKLLNERRLKKQREKERQERKRDFEDYKRNKGLG